MSHHIHEDRLVALLQCLLPREAIRSEVSVPRASRRIDLLLRLGPPQDFWGPLGPLLSNRTVVLEHEHHPPRRRKLLGAMGKLAWVHEGEAAGGEAEAEARAVGEDHVDGEPASRARRPPLLLVLSPGCPRWIAEGQEGFTPWEHEGIYRARAPLLGEVVFVHLRGLAPTPGNSVLRLLAPPRSDEEARANIRRLMEDEKMVESTRRAIEEAIMQDHVIVSSAERQSLVDQIFEQGQRQGERQGERQGIRQGIRQGERQALLRLAAALVEPDELAALEGIEDQDELEARFLTLLRR